MSSACDFFLTQTPMPVLFRKFRKWNLRGLKHYVYLILSYSIILYLCLMLNFFCCGIVGLCSPNFSSILHICFCQALCIFFNYFHLCSYFLGVSNRIGLQWAPRVPSRSCANPQNFGMLSPDVQICPTNISKKRLTKQAFTKKGSPCRYIFCFWVGFRNCFPRKSEAVRKSKVLSQDLCIAYMSRISETVRKSQTSARIFRIFWLVRKSQSLSMNVPKTCLTHGP